MHCMLVKSADLQNILEIWRSAALRPRFGMVLNFSSTLIQLFQSRSLLYYLQKYSSVYCFCSYLWYEVYCYIINLSNVRRKNVVNNVDMSSLREPWQNGPYKNKHTEQHKRRNRHLEQNSVFVIFGHSLSCYVIKQI